MLELRKGRAEDAAAVGRLFEEARAALKGAGIDQWQDGYPNEEDARADIEAGVGYVIEEAGQVLAYACLAFGREPTYDVIFEGAWQGEGEYGFLHRAAVAGEAKGRGLAGMLFDELKRQAKERGVGIIRGDTHRDNLPMQRVMAKSGLEYRGVIYVEDGSQRLAFEALLGE